MTHKYKFQNFDFQFTDKDIVNPDDCISDGSNPHNVHAFVLLDGGFVQAVVFSDCLQDAIDIAVDEDKLTQFALDESELLLPEYQEGGDMFELITYLGNYGKPYDIDTLEAFEIPASKWSRALILADGSTL